MMSKREEYRRILRGLADWEPFLLDESGLPGPRGNLELAQAVADEGGETLFERLIARDPASAPVNSPAEFLVVCGTIGLGRLAAEGRTDLLATLRTLASDPRWRTREAVAMALQRVGEQDMDLLLEEMDRWIQGSPLERRAAAAAVCEPKLLTKHEHAERALALLDRITESVGNAPDRRGDDFKALRKGLGYCWSVAVAALPNKGMRMMERWFAGHDPDVIWIMRENLKKNRLVRIDPEWVERARRRLG